MTVAARPVCLQCAKKLSPHYEYKQVKVETPNLVGSVDVSTQNKKTSRILGYGYAGAGHFCSQRCGWEFALAMVGGQATLARCVEPGAAISPQRSESSERVNQSVAALVRRGMETQESAKREALKEGRATAPVLTFDLSLPTPEIHKQLRARFPLALDLHCELEEHPRPQGWAYNGETLLCKMMHAPSLRRGVGGGR